MAISVKRNDNPGDLPMLISLLLKYWME